MLGKALEHKAMYIVGMSWPLMCYLSRARSQRRWDTWLAASSECRSEDISSTRFMA